MEILIIYITKVIVMFIDIRDCQFVSYFSALVDVCDETITAGCCRRCRHLVCDRCVGSVYR